MRKRTADKAGVWYEGTAQGLAEEVDACLEQARRDYATALRDGAGQPAAIVVPHAGLAYSGPIAAAGFLAVRDRYERVDVFVVFGASHRASPAQPAILSEGAWETPLGDIAVDRDLARAFIEGGVGTADPRPHIGDNAIELQTPFIKHLFPDAAMVPLAVSFIPDAWRLGETAARLATKSGKTVVAVASTDLTHYGAAFGVMPAGVGQPALDWTRQNDERFLKTLVDMDLENIVATANRDGSACGAGAAAAAAGWAKARGCRHGRLLAHTNSHEVQPSGVADHLVGYAAVVFEDDPENRDQ